MKKTLVVALSFAALTAFTAGAVYSECSQDKDKKCCSTSAKAAAASKDPTAQEVVIDPVCGMDVKVSENKYSSKYNDKTYHFCSASCKKAFDKNPSKYIGGKSK
jgi:YHS domain-containing protein